MDKLKEAIEQSKKILEYWKSVFPESDPGHEALGLVIEAAEWVIKNKDKLAMFEIEDWPETPPDTALTPNIICFRCKYYNKEKQECNHRYCLNKHFKISGKEEYCILFKEVRNK
jgi:hypothetical protein